MFSQLISFIKKKKEKSKNNRRKNSNVSLAEEASEVVDACETALNSHVTIEVANLPSTSRPLATLTLLRGSSDSKPATEESSESDGGGKTETPTEESSESDGAGKTETPTKSRSNLYPTLDVPISRVKNKPAAVVEKQESKKLKSIHDMVEEIPCVIDPRILYAEESDRRLAILKNLTCEPTIALMNLIKNLSGIDYEFKRELEVKDNSSDDVIASKYYKKITSFYQLQIHLKPIQKKKKTVSRKNRDEDSIKTPIVFKSFSKSLRCYRGKVNDLVDCP